MRGMKGGGGGDENVLVVLFFIAQILAPLMLYSKENLPPNTDALWPTILMF